MTRTGEQAAQARATMRAMLIPFIGGASAGLIHVLSGPDHLAAIAPLASDSQRRFWTTGALWGLGHSSGVFVVGLAALAFRSWLPIDALSSWSERIVGVVLIGIGLWGLRRALSTRVHTHTHSHGGLTHTHTHAHGHTHRHAPAVSGPASVSAGGPVTAAADRAADAGADGAATAAVAGDATVTPVAGAHASTATSTAVGAALAHPAPHNHTHAAFAVGVLHGLAGSSHFLGVLPALGLPDLPSSIAYLTGYGAGTVTGMTLFAAVMGLLAARAHISGPRATRWLLSTCSAAAILVGAAWLAM